ncbi:efflux transporter, RND family, MFP subunit [Thermobaculum terrenum ATCC BAA-798]|uniref:Efflux transporter, RND family, MFP subunit n=1 Tax=Thermobaculum terrenum (strain ATCC BAA-798 / CCMEE 7001 / YNP1) TaxID=525904 RepID=D1CE41_THET1|nr:HlyD family efflux transporter periplasmic adaptor subunit [Thermobaculum terrenum]ACZ41197.1 efflux transporter, RND family, MFP subunit [Thermobaculum terrenum ATCC BAA-798]
MFKQAGKSLRVAIYFMVFSVFCFVLSGCSVPGVAQVPPTPTPLPPQPEVEKPIYTVKRGDIVELLRLTGRVSAVNEKDLQFTKSGNVLKVNVEVGDKVRKGQLLAELDQSDLVKQLEQAQLELDQANLALQQYQNQHQTDVALAELDLQEAQLKLEAATSELDRKLAEIAVKRAQIKLDQIKKATNEELQKQVAQARLNYERIKDQIDAGRIYAPFNGVVEIVNIKPGDPVQPFQSVMTIMDPGEKEIRVDNTTSAELSQLSPHQKVQIRFLRYSDKVVSGEIRMLPTGDQGSGGAIRISYNPDGLDVDIGDIANITVILQQKRNVLWLPPQAIRTFQGRQFVVVQEGDRQRRVDVELGIQSQDKVEITSGLKEGQKVVGQ